jgi:hypothetical protein
MDQDYTIDNWEEKIGNGDDLLALAVHQRGGDDQPLFAPQAADGLRRDLHGS